MPLDDSLNPLVTIITPSFNQGEFIERTIQSIHSQDYPFIEHIVIDGGSTDGTLEILKKYEGKLKWISEKDTGQSNAINKGFGMATGQILAWLNSDDVYLPGAVSKAVKYLSENPGVMMVYGEGYMIDERDVIKGRFPFTEPKFDLAKLIYYGDYILQQTSFFRRSIFDSIDMLEESYHYTMDWDLFIRIGKRFTVGYIPEDIACIREHGTAKTAIGGKVRFREIVKMLRQHSALRYPPAYFNYMWDAYGKDVFEGNSGDGRVSVKARILSMVKRIAQNLFATTGLQHYDGWHPDGWVGPKALIVLPNLDIQTPKNTVRIQGQVTAPNLPLRIRIRVNSKFEHDLIITQQGEFVAEVRLPEKHRRDDSYHLQFTNSRSYVPAHYGAKKDHRQLSFILKRLEIL